MKAMILAAGLGTRLKPWTLTHPKALVPVGGIPMLERVIVRLKGQGFDDITVNVHHFSDQIVEFLSQNKFGVSIHISDESGHLLDTGGGILHAAEYLDCGEPFLVHNVDILSDADLCGLMQYHKDQGNDISLLVSNRESSRKLLFTEEMQLAGWKNLTTGEIRNALKEGIAEGTDSYKEYAFSGIHVMSPTVFAEMRSLGFEGEFPVMDFLLNPDNALRREGYLAKDLKLIDIGKPATLAQANTLF